MTPREAGFAVAPDWAPQDRYWLAWPAAAWRGDADAGRDATAGLARLLADRLPVSVIANGAEVVDVSLRCGPGVGAIVVPHAESAMRAIGPTFLRDGNGLAGIRWPADGGVGGAILDHLGLPRFDGPAGIGGAMVDVDGEGTALATEILLPALGGERDRAEALLADWLGVERVIWLRADLDGGRAGHILDCARFLRPGLVLALSEENDGDSNAPLLHENLERLALARDARNRKLEVVRLPQPKARAAADGSRLVMSYADCLIAGSLIVLPAFEDNRDQIAYDRVVGAALDDTVLYYPAVEIAQGGSGLGTMVLGQPSPG